MLRLPLGLRMRRPHRDLLLLLSETGPGQSATKRHLNSPLRVHRSQRTAEGVPLELRNFHLYLALRRWPLLPLVPLMFAPLLCLLLPLWERVARRLRRLLDEAS